MLCFLCLVFVVFWFFFSITEENKQSLLWWGLPVLLLCCSCFICRTERSAHRALPAGPRRLHVGNLEPEEVEQKPKGLEERRAVPNAKELKSHRLSLPTRHLCMALWQSLPLVGRALLWCGTRNKHGSAQRSYAGSDLSWSCRDKHTGLKWMGCDCIASLVHIPRALKGIFFLVETCVQSPVSHQSENL